MPYVDINTVQSYNPGDILTGAALQQIRNNGEFFIDPPACSVYNSVVQSTGDAAVVALSANSENYDNDSMHSTSTNNSRITAMTAGRYLVTFVVSFTANANGWRFVEVIKNGATVTRMTSSRPEATGTLATQLSGALTLVLSAGDYIQCRSYQNSGGALDVSLNEFAAMFMTR